jgi:hypothetical protein
MAYVYYVPEACILELKIDISGARNAQEFLDEQVTVIGEVEIMDYLERRKVLIFGVTSAATLEEDSE